MDVTGRLEGWKKDPMFNIIWGYIYGDTRGRFLDGTWIHTSSIPDMKEFQKGDVVQTLNSRYLLGERSFVDSERD